MYLACIYGINQWATGWVFVGQKTKFAYRLNPRLDKIATEIIWDLQVFLMI